MNRNRRIVTGVFVLLILAMALSVALASSAAGPPPAGRVLGVFRVDSAGLYGPLDSRYQALGIVEIDGRPHALAWVENGRGLSEEMPAGFRVLASESPDLRLYWLHDAVDQDMPPDVQVLLRDAQRLLVQADPSYVASLVIAGVPLIAARPMASPRELLNPLPTITSPDPDILGIMNQVNVAELSDHVADLSGENEVVISGSPTTILTRYSGTPGMFDAADYLMEYYAGLGLPAELTPYRTDDWVNVIATQTGILHPDQIYVICAHYDSISRESPLTYAPGADDNASGTAAVMTAAAILSGYSFDYTIRYVHFSGEEQGLYGSHAYAHQAANLDEDILGAINLDMIAWDGEGGPDFDLHSGQSGSLSHQLAQVFDDVVDMYDLDLDIEIRLGAAATTRSDHAAFWDEGYAAFLAIEDWDDFTPWYHSTSDRADTLNLDYFVNVTKASVGTLAVLAHVLTESVSTPTPTNTPTPWPTPAGTNHLADGDFETGPSHTAWRMQSGGGYALISQANPHGGEWGAWLSQQDHADDSICQTVSLPAGAQDIWLEFWWQMQTDEVIYGYDWLEARLLPSGYSTPIVLARLDSGGLQHVWLPNRFSLQSHAGREGDICFVSHSDYWVATHFFIDDVQLTCDFDPVVTVTPAATTTPTATAQPAVLWLPLLRK